MTKQQLESAANEAYKQYIEDVGLKDTPVEKGTFLCGFMAGGHCCSLSSINSFKPVLSS